MKNTKTLLAAAILSLVALAGNSQAQTPTPPNPNAGTYLDNKLSLSQRLRLADGMLSTGTDAETVAAAAEFMLTSRPVSKLLSAYPTFALSVAADPTLSGTINDPGAISVLYYDAVRFNTDATPALNDKVTYLSPLLSSTEFAAAQALAIKSVYGDLVGQQARVQFQAGNYAGAIATAAPVLGWRQLALSVTFQSKVALRSPDVLSWARLIYMLADFRHTQDGIDAVSSAYRALDMNLVRANAFIQYQKDGIGTNPLASIPFPSVTFIGGSPSHTADNFGVAGDNLDALRIAARQFSAATSGRNLNDATAFVAQWLRNTDCNLVRANAFVTAQSQGRPFTIAELQGN